MRYITEINCFYDWLETNSISSAAIALWHALMHINNKAGWKRQFAVATSVLEIKTSLARSTIFKARNQLIQVGRINCVSRKGSQSALYEIISFEGNGNICVYQKDAIVDTTIDAIGRGLETQSGTQLETINRLDKTRQDCVINAQEETGNKAFVLYQNKVGLLNSSYAAQKLEEITKEYPEEWVEQAILITGDQQEPTKRSVNYVDGILKRWAISGQEKPWEAKNNGRDKRNTKTTSPRASEVDWEAERRNGF